MVLKDIFKEVGSCFHPMYEVLLKAGNSVNSVARQLTEANPYLHEEILICSSHTLFIFWGHQTLGNNEFHWHWGDAGKREKKTP